MKSSSISAVIVSALVSFATAAAPRQCGFTTYTNNWSDDAPSIEFCSKMQIPGDIKQLDSGSSDWQLIAAYNQCGFAIKTGKSGATLSQQDLTDIIADWLPQGSKNGLIQMSGEMPCYRSPTDKDMELVEWKVTAVVPSPTPHLAKD